MHLKSTYPEVPAFPEVNAHFFFFKRPDQQEWPDFTLYIDAVTGQKRTFREISARVQDLGTALGAPLADGGLGLRSEDGEIIGIMGDNSLEYINLLHSCLLIATPFALISSHATPFEFKHSLTLTNVTRLFVDAKFLPVVLPVAKEVGFPLSKIYLINGQSKGMKNLADMVDEVRAKKISPVAMRPAKKDTLAYLVFSSGTSGLPKAVKISHGNLIFSLAQGMVAGQRVLEASPPPTPKTPEGNPVVLAFLPMYHSAGLHHHCFRSLFSPATYIVMPRWDIEAALKLIPRYKVTYLMMVPSIVHQLVHHPKIHQVDLSSVDSLGSGAAYLPPALAESMAALSPKGVRFFEGYGMSETTIAAIAVPLPIDNVTKRIPGCTGVLLPGMEARIVRDDGSEADFDEPGELWLKGENIVSGYWNNKQATEEAFVDGWLRTGDKFKVDKEQNFFFLDRAKDTLKVSGAQVAPSEIEFVLLSHPRKFIKDVTVAGVSGGRTSDEKVPRAWVVLSEEGKKVGEATVLKELQKWHQEKLSRYKWLRGGIEAVDEIPKSPAGKTLRRLLQEKYERGMLVQSKL